MTHVILNAAKWNEEPLHLLSPLTEIARPFTACSELSRRVQGDIHEDFKQWLFCQKD